MLDRTRNDDDDAQAPPKLVAALDDFQKARLFVPPSVDEAVLAKAGEHLKQQPKRQSARWNTPLRWAALAASFIVVAWLTHTLTKPAPSTGSFVPEDINHDGQVDILDAFALARRIESGGALDTRWDLNGDGRINRADVNAIAARAVRLRRVVAADVRRLWNEGQVETRKLEPSYVGCYNHTRQWPKKEHRS